MPWGTWCVSPRKDARRASAKDAISGLQSHDKHEQPKLDMGINGLQSHDKNDQPKLDQGVNGLQSHDKNDHSKLDKGQAARFHPEAADATFAKKEALPPLPSPQRTGNTVYSSPSRRSRPSVDDLLTDLDIIVPQVALDPVKPQPRTQAEKDRAARLAAMDLPLEMTLPAEVYHICRMVETSQDARPPGWLFHWAAAIGITEEDARGLDCAFQDCSNSMEVGMHVRVDESRDHPEIKDQAKCFIVGMCAECAERRVGWHATTDICQPMVIPWSPWVPTKPHGNKHWREVLEDSSNGRADESDGDDEAAEPHAKAGAKVAREMEEVEEEKEEKEEKEEAADGEPRCLHRDEEGLRCPLAGEEVRASGYCGDHEIYHDEGMQALADAVFKSDSSVERLLQLGTARWSRNGEIEHAHVDAIKLVIQHGTNLTHLTVSETGLTDESAQAIAKALRNNATLKILRMCNLGLTDLSGHAFANALRQNSALLELHLEGNTEMTGESGEAIAKVLGTNNSTLEVLNLSGCPVLTAESMQAFVEALSANETLRKLQLGCDDDLDEDEALSELREAWSPRPPKSVTIR